LIVHRLRDLELSFDETKGVLGTLFLVGTQTTSVAVPRIIALLVDIGQWARLRATPALPPSAIDEGLRCTVPVPATIRSVATEATVAGHRFRRGSRAFIFRYNVAKHPRLFPHPAASRHHSPLHRPRAKHVWYGSGPH